MDPIVDYYLGTGTDARDRTIDEVWNFDHARLEGVHDYIQWLFPTDRPSAFNTRAPVLDDRALAAMRTSPDIRERLLRSLDLLLDFYGLERATDSGATTIEHAPSLDERGPHWWNAGNHNHLRLTRIITSLRLLGLADEAVALRDALERLRRERRTGISEETARHWTAAAGGAL
jgi:hypothetical protein